MALSVGCSEPGPTITDPIADIVYPKAVTVTEGSATEFQIALTPVPMVDVKGVVYTGDATVAKVDPDEFTVLAMTSSATMTVYGVADGVATPGNRGTRLNGRLGNDDAATTGGIVEVVDIESENVVASNWNVVMPVSAMASFDVQLTQPPSAIVNVTVTLGSDASSPSLLMASPVSLQFDSSNYNKPQTVSVQSGALAGAGRLDLRPDNGMSAQGVVVTVSP